MTWSHPEMLWGLLAMALPPLIHLFRLQRRKNIAFPDIRLLEALLRETRSTRKITRWLLMALRMLAIGCLFIALAGPQWGSNADEPGQDWLVVLDLGPRSSLTNGSSTTGQELLRAANQIIGSAGAQTRIRILTGGQTEPTPPLSRTEALTHLAQLRATSQGLSESAVAAASRQATTTRIRLGMPDAGIPTDSLPWFGWMAETGEAFNTTFDSVWTDPPAPPPGAPFQLHFTLSFSGTPQGSVNLQLFNNGQPEGTMPVQAGALPVQVSFPLRAEGDSATWTAVVSGDHLPVDDTLWFGLPWQEPAFSVARIQSAALAKALERLFPAGNSPTIRFDSSPGQAARLFAESGGWVFILPEEPLNYPGAVAASSQELLRWSAPSVQRTLGKALTASPNALSMPQSQPLVQSLPGWTARMTYENGTPLLLEQRVGTGTMYLFNAQTNGQWEMAPLTGVLIYALWLQGQNSTPWLIFSGDETPLRMDVTVGETPVQFNRNNLTTIPAQRAMGSQTLVNGTFFQGPPGMYRVVHQGNFLGLCGVNPSRQAGMLNLLPTPDWYENHPEFTPINNPSAFAQTGGASSLWDPATLLLLMALSVLVLESIWSQYRHT